MCRLAREAGVGDLVKLEVIGDQARFDCDAEAENRLGRLQGAAVYNGRSVAPAASGDRMCDSAGGADWVRQGIRNPFNLRIIMEQACSGDRRCGRRHCIGRRRSDGIDAIGWINPALLARATDREARQLAVEANARHTGECIEMKLYATASSPLSGLIGEPPIEPTCDLPSSRSQAGAQRGGLVAMAGRAGGGSAGHGRTATARKGSRGANWSSWRETARGYLRSPSCVAARQRSARRRDRITADGFTYHEFI